MTTNPPANTSSPATRGRVVSALDGSPASAAAVRWAAELARGLGVGLVVAHREQQAEQFEALRLDGVPVEQVTVQGLLRSALSEATQDASCVVAPTRGAGAPIAQVLDARADELLSRARGPVALVPAPSWNSLESGVVVGLDLDRPGLGALGFAHHLAARCGAPLRVVVAHTDSSGGADRALVEARRLVEEHAPDHEGPREVEVVAWSPADGLAAAGMGAGVVVVGSREAGYRSAHPDSQSRRLLRQASVPVVVVKDLG